MDHLPPRPLPARPPEGHKGDFGRVGIVGGCAGPVRMLGAPCLAARAALRAGCGLVRFAVPRPLLTGALVLEPHATAIALPTRGGELIPHEATRVVDELASWADAMVVGCGLGVSPGALAASLRAAQQAHAPAVLDADALNVLATLPELTRDMHARAVLTPHPGEYARLAASLRLPAAGDTDASRASAAAALARRLASVVVLKGARTIVTDGLDTWISPHVSSTLAVPGSGDVLAGLLGALLARLCGPVAVAGGTARPLDPARSFSLFEAASLGVDLHAKAGAAWRTRNRAAAGMRAEELADALPAEMEGATAAP
ncbi:MAG: NAD(P)H-hydrate dehydratase [Phycisphaerales bacterium]|nr:NAD(P)H-hydrate dehydratase [Phycisphaerales bacterium]